MPFRNILTQSAKLFLLAAVGAVAPHFQPSLAQSLTNGLVAYWPLDELQADKTPDVISGYDMQARNLVASDVVPGVRSNAFNFENSRQTLLVRVHDAGDDLPINKHAAFTISMWTKVNGSGQSDLRVFSEGNTTVSDPLFNLGTHSTGGSGQLDIFIRQAGATAVNHLLPPLNHLMMSGVTWSSSSRTMGPASSISMGSWTISSSRRRIPRSTTISTTRPSEEFSALPLRTGSPV